MEHFGSGLKYFEVIATRQVALELMSITFLEIKTQRGAILERWDGIDGYLIKKLLDDPRFPSMPTYFSYTETFSEPINWGDNYGSRIRGYFVPQETGPHVFFIGENAENEWCRGGQFLYNPTNRRSFPGKV